LTETLESKRPLTRSVLEARIAKAENEVAEALERKEYEACGLLQTKIDELIAKRQDFPTVQELKDNVAAAEAAVAAAAANRDFSGAASAQSSVDKAKRSLQDALENEKVSDGDEEVEKLTDDKEKEAEGDGIESRAQLELKISWLRKSVEEAISSKDFAKASLIQSDLDKKEALRKFFPSLEELEERLDGLRKTCDSAIAQKDFAKAGELHNQIDSL